jgi:two-component system response regulator MprA
MPNRILIVDDNASVRHRVRRHLESQPGFATCEEAVDGVEAIEKVATSKPDLIVMDHAMPRMNGLHAATVLKNISRETPIILFVSSSEAIPEHRFRFMGVRSIVSKSWPIELLLKEVHRLIGVTRSACA